MLRYLWSGEMPLLRRLRRLQPFGLPKKVIMLVEDKELLPPAADGQPGASIESSELRIRTTLAGRTTPRLILPSCMTHRHYLATLKGLWKCTGDPVN